MATYNYQCTNISGGAASQIRALGGTTFYDGRFWIAIVPKRGNFLEALTYAGLTIANGCLILDHDNLDRSAYHQIFDPNYLESERAS